MNRPAVRLASFAVLGPLAFAASAPAAWAKAPANVPTLEDIQQHARQLEAKAREKERDASRDPTKETIDDYQSKKTALDDWQKLAQIIKDDKTQELQDYRTKAADAIVARFLAEDLKSPMVRQVRIAIGLELCELLQAPARDAVGLEIAERVFNAWWRSELLQTRWSKGGKQRDRKTACDKIRKFLKNSEKD